MINNTFDEEVYDLAVKIAQREFHQHPNTYRCEVLDLAGDLFNFYNHYTKPHLERAKDPKGFAAKGLYFALASIRQLAQEESSRILIESEILDGRFEGNNYFELLEGAGKLNHWNDNEKVINTQENSTSNQGRDCTWDKIDSPVGEVEKHEFWNKLESLLSERDYMIILEVKVYGKTEQEVAEKVGITRQAVYKVIQKLSKFKEDFKEYR